MCRPLYVASLAWLALTATSTAFPLTHTSTIDTLTLTNSLSDYYENIVNQVMETMTRDIVVSAPHTFMDIHSHTLGDHSCRTSLRAFIRSLHTQLDGLQTHLLDSVRPLVESNLPSHARPSLDTAKLNDAIIILNRHISFQLDIILNPPNTARRVIQQSITKIDDQMWDDTLVQRPIQMTSSLLEDSTLREASELTTWLAGSLSEMGGILRVEFDGRVQDAMQSMMEDFLEDE
ncbi:hypothetical protein J3Q64DRAFT_1694833 [Phycomyces blakesleeanus]|uniref:Uncharacterized protein n=2 Tax=Phycomyces blakesleeanus TaxID=4837 RepID=A0A167PXR7_PHYB8|nr:hypothetical protein PHYBLDRAFT_140792 [Phycomyces blakesleeanus NRRL 1555(-)]OAD78734.1 hypothetical protein PHYBLDRAFT_140792 [Phycomyces blakesleeanus NRRL 1555(-)]|eukprot:XP_018296774.1 hypothetical protein PHYBLDRAFT_140792 [Phycomyces blakesleeanus NRRL 1555(-)]